MKNHNATKLLLVGTLTAAALSGTEALIYNNSAERDNGASQAYLASHQLQDSAEAYKNANDQDFQRNIWLAVVALDVLASGAYAMGAVLDSRKNDANAQSSVTVTSSHPGVN